MDLKKINELQANDKIDGFFLVKSAEMKTSSNNKKYMDFTLADKTGEMNAKLWEVEEGDEEKYSSNMLIKVRGTVNQWQTTLQLKIEKLRGTVPSDDVKIEDFVATAPLEADFMYTEIFKFINSMKSEDIKNVTASILEEVRDKLMHYPAAPQ
jgi:3'-5' exoribonuclease